MKRILFVLMAVLPLTACSFVSDDYENSESSGSVSIVSPSLEVSSSIDSSLSGKIFKIDSSISELTINSTEDLGGKSVYYAVVNTGSRKVPKEYSRYICDGNSFERSSVANTYEPVFEDEEESDSDFACFHDVFSPEFEKDSSRAVYAESVNEVGKLSLSAGKTSKKFFVNLKNEYLQKTATLYAFNAVCNVWILDGDAFVSEEAVKFNLASAYAEKFAAIYPMIRNVFGNESDEMYISTSGKKDSMEKLSETGTKVNILIYDIFDDKNDGGTIGLFSNMDYYKNGLRFSNLTVNRSNEGKVFYIDSYFAVKLFDYTISTLAHEFQHMINFGVKSMRGLASDANLNEMLSMLCEDMMQQYLGISDDYSPKNRIRTFIKRYYSTGIRNYDETLVSYANAYIFGAWLAREYGGAAFVKAMMSNDKANDLCIAEAVSTMTGKKQDLVDIFAEFINAVFNPESSAFVRNADEGIVFNSYSYPMKGFSSFDCPIIFENLAVSDIPASYGVMLKKHAEIADGQTSVKLNFASESGMTMSNVVVYACIK